jgi:hypothetical protein
VPTSLSFSVTGRRWICWAANAAALRTSFSGDSSIVPLIR